MMNRKLIFAAAVYSLLNFVSCGEVTATSINNEEPQVNSTVIMIWKVTPGDDEFINGLSLLVLPYVRNPVMIGAGEVPSLQSRGKTLFGDRLSGTYNKDGEHKYVVTLNDIQYNESKSFQLKATFEKNSSGIIKTATITIKDVVGSPNVCGKGWKSNGPVPENDTVTFTQDICGNPKPVVQWKIGRDSVFNNSIASVTVDNKIRQYRYSFKKQLRRKDCGKLVVWNAVNAVGSTGWNTTVNVTFTPSLVSIRPYKHNKSCIHVTWDREDTGKCILNYHLKFDGKGVVYNTSDKHFTQCDSPNALYVMVWASYSRFSGNITTRNISKLPPPTTTTTTTTQKVITSSPAEDSNIGLIVGIVGGILFVIIIIIIVVCVLKHKKKNGTGNHSGYAMRVTGEENNYVTNPTHSNERRPGNPDDPEQAIYSELGPGGGRTGPRPAPEQSDYAEMKVDAMGYPIDGAKGSEPPTYAPIIKPREGAKRRTPSPSRSNVDGARAAASAEPPTYAPIIKNRSSSRGRSPPPDEDDHEGVIV